MGDEPKISLQEELHLRIESFLEASRYPKFRAMKSGITGVIPT